MKRNSWKQSRFDNSSSVALVLLRLKTSLNPLQSRNFLHNRPTFCPCTNSPSFGYPLMRRLATPDLVSVNRRHTAANNLWSLLIIPSFISRDEDTTLAAQHHTMSILVLSRTARPLITFLHHLVCTNKITRSYQMSSRNFLRSQWTSYGFQITPLGKVLEKANCSSTNFEIFAFMEREGSLPC
jgi:hypothetical protein